MKKSSPLLAICLTSTALANITSSQAFAQGLEIDDSPLLKSSNRLVASVSQMSQNIDPEILAKLAKFSYSVNKGQEFNAKDHQLMVDLINDGWVLKPFSTKTGTANNQVESVGGIVAFKGTQVVVATRGTVTVPDWQTNFRPKKSLWQSACSFFGFGKKENDTTTANFFYGVTGSVAQGNLQRHLSSWEEISDLIIEYATSRGLKPSDLDITFAGHSQGAAQAHLNALNAVTDKRFGFCKTLSESFIVPQGEDLTISFNAIGNYSPLNNGKLTVLGFEPPRVFSDEAAQHAKTMVGEENITNIINKRDIVPMVPTELMGFKHVGKITRIDSGHFWGIAPHLMKNMAGPAVTALRQYWKVAPAA